MKEDSAKRWTEKRERTKKNKKPVDAPYSPRSMMMSDPNYNPEAGNQRGPLPALTGYSTFAHGYRARTARGKPTGRFLYHTTLPDMQNENLRMAPDDWSGQFMNKWAQLENLGKQSNSTQAVNNALEGLRARKMPPFWYQDAQGAWDPQNPFEKYGAGAVYHNPQFPQIYADYLAMQRNLYG